MPPALTRLQRPSPSVRTVSALLPDGHRDDHVGDAQFVGVLDAVTVGVGEHRARQAVAAGAGPGDGSQAAAGRRADHAADRPLAHVAGERDAEGRPARVVAGQAHVPLQAVQVEVVEGDVAHRVAGRVAHGHRGAVGQFDEEPLHVLADAGAGHGPVERGPMAVEVAAVIGDEIVADHHGVAGALGGEVRMRRGGGRGLGTAGRQQGEGGAEREEEPGCGTHGSTPGCGCSAPVGETASPARPGYLDARPSCLPLQAARSGGRTLKS